MQENDELELIEQNRPPPEVLVLNILNQISFADIFLLILKLIKDFKHSYIYD